MGLLNEKDKVIIEAVKKYAASENIAAEKIKFMLDNTSTLKSHVLSLSEKEIQELKSTIDKDEFLRISKIIDEVKKYE